MMNGTELKHTTVCILNLFQESGLAKKLRATIVSALEAGIRLQVQMVRIKEYAQSECIRPICGKMLEVDSRKINEASPDPGSYLFEEIKHEKTMGFS